MDVRGEKVLFTSSEAAWAQDSHMLFMTVPGLAQRILDARVQAAEHWLAPDALPFKDIAAARKSLRTRVALDESMKRLHETTVQYTSDELGNERPVVAVHMDRREKELLLRYAKADYDEAQLQLDTPELADLRDQDLRDDLAFDVSSSDHMTPREAVATCDGIHDPVLITVYEDYRRAVAVNNAAVLGPMIVDLEADLA